MKISGRCWGPITLPLVVLGAKRKGFLFASCLLLVAPLTARAAESTDDRLARIEAKMLTREEFKLFVESQNSRFESINQRFESINQRFEDMNKRIEFMETLLIALLTVVVGSTLYNIWDRKKELDLRLRVERIESELHQLREKRA